MWSILKPRPLGRTPMRRITLFVSAMFMALFATILINFTSVYAQASEEIATWSGQNISYGGQTIERFDRPPDIDDGRYPNFANTPCRNSVPIFFSENLDGPAVRHESPEYREDRYWTHVICLTEGSDGSDKSQPINAILLDFSVPKSEVNGGNPTGDDYSTFIQHSITIYPEGTDPSSVDDDGDGDSEPTSTCSGDGTIGVGWFVCPVTRWMAAGMDALFGILESFLKVAPLSTDTDSPHYTMWRIMQNLANILFIIGFLIIIYSQITNVGISNYGIKRLLPRLVIAAVLVNVSYWICAVAVDLSNIFGATLYDLLTGISVTLQESTDTDVTADDITWSAVAGVVLSGGAAGAAAIGAAAGVATSAGASLWFLLVGLAGVMVSALVAILIFAARQALITIFIVISPLAFVAYLLPSTEKYFDRWRFFFFTMLVLYPVLSFVFGGAQLAGWIIILGALENPDNPNFFNVIILGMIVQVAPVLVTPLLIKFGGSLLGRIAGIANDPNKGLIDKTRKFAQTRHDMTKNRQLWDRDQNGRLRNRNPLAATGRWNALRDENNANKLKAWQGAAHAEYERKHSGAHDVYNQNRFNEMIKATGEDDAKKHFEHAVTHNESVRNLYYEQRVNRDEAEAASKYSGTLYEGLKADPATIAKGALEKNLGERSKAADQYARSLETRETSARQLQEKAYNERIINAAETELREFAGFNEIDTQGVARIVNVAQEVEAKRYETLVEAGRRTLLREEANLKELEELIEKGTSSNAKFAHFSGDLESKSAAIRVFMETAPMAMRHELAATMDMSKNAPRGSEKGAFRSEIAGGLAKNKPFFISQTFLNAMAEGRLDPTYNGIPGRNMMIADTLNKFAFDAQSMVSIDQDDIGAIADFLKSPQRAMLTPEAEAQIIEALGKAFDKRDRYEGQMGKRRNNLNEVRRQLGLPPITK